MARTRGRGGGGGRNLAPCESISWGVWAHMFNTSMVPVHGSFTRLSWFKDNSNPSRPLTASLSLSLTKLLYIAHSVVDARYAYGDIRHGAMEDAGWPSRTKSARRVTTSPIPNRPRYNARGQW